MEQQDQYAYGSLIASNLPYYTTQFVYTIPLSQGSSENYYIGIDYNCTLPVLCETDSYPFTILGEEDQSSSSDGISTLRIAEYIGNEFMNV